MAELIKVYTQEVPALRFIGKQYSDSDRVDGGFGKQWGAFFANNWMGMLEKLVPDVKSMYEDSGAYIGLMRWKEGESFQYWIGMFMPPDTVAPEGFGQVDFAPATLGVGWLQGPESNLYGQEEKTAKGLEEAGHKIADDGNGAYWFFERYSTPRFTTPDEKGNVILDICHYIK